MKTKKDEMDSIFIAVILIGVVATYLPNLFSSNIDNVPVLVIQIILFVIIMYLINHFIPWSTAKSTGRPSIKDGELKSNIVSAFHTSNPEDHKRSPVWHWHDDCSEGKKILPKDRELGIKGNKCEICKKLEVNF